MASSNNSNGNHAAQTQAQAQAQSATFYAQALKQVGDMSGQVKKLATEIRDNEDEHVDALKAAIEGAGAKPVKAPGVKFGAAFKNEKSFLKLAQTLEDTGVSAYNGAATQIQSKDLLSAAASIAQVEARHAGALRELSGQDATVGPFDGVLSGEEADAVVHRLAPS